MRKPRRREVAAEALEPVTVGGGNSAIGMEVEVFEVCVAPADRPHPRGIGVLPTRRMANPVGTLARRRTHHGRSRACPLSDVRPILTRAQIIFKEATMPEWTRGEKIALCSLVVAIVSCPILYQTSVFRELIGLDEPDNRKQPIPTNPEVLDHEQERMRAKRSLHLHLQRMHLRLERNESLERQYVSEGSQAVYKVKLSNSCMKGDIKVSVCYIDLLGDWLTRGWWLLEPGQSIIPNIATTNRFAFLYGESIDPNVELSWDGRSEGSTQAITITDGKFEQLIHEEFAYDNPSIVSFVREDLKTEIQPHNVSFSCD